jgi:predicted acetylornithine/succinylornithine family transaminase
VSAFRTPAAIVAPAEAVREQFIGERHLLQNYARAPVEIVRGEGCELIDADGNRYLDMVAGIAVCALGHAHPDITEAIAVQAGTLVQASNLFYHEPAGTLANELARRSGLERVFFCNSGSEANEAAIKLARKLAYRKGETKRVTILSCEGSFHGRTLGALAATANPHYKEGFEPLPGGFATTPFNDVAALERAIDETVAGVIVEPVQGESGVKPADRDFLAAARRLCDRHGALLIFDEIQCGMGRLGTLFAFETFEVRPDVVTIAKSLANGLPIGAMLVDSLASKALQPGDHGSTFGGSPVPCAAALAHLRVRDAIGLDAHVREAGEALRDGLEALHQRYPAMFAPPRGLGLMLGLPVREPYEAKALVARARIAQNLLLNAAGDNTLRFVPPLIITGAEVTDALTRLASAAAEIDAETAGSHGATRA